jgi:hypothetical protein
MLEKDREARERESEREREKCVYVMHSVYISGYTYFM